MAIFRPNFLIGRLRSTLKQRIEVPASDGVVGINSQSLAVMGPRLVDLPTGSKRLRRD